MLMLDVARMLEWEKEWLRVCCDGLGMLKAWERSDWCKKVYESDVRGVRC